MTADHVVILRRNMTTWSAESRQTNLDFVLRTSPYLVILSQGTEFGLLKTGPKIGLERRHHPVALR